MGEGLTEIADQALRLGIVFLGEEADVGAQLTGCSDYAVSLRGLALRGSPAGSTPL
jgi:hypothetical protein